VNNIILNFCFKSNCLHKVKIVNSKTYASAPTSLGARSAKQIN